MEIFPVEYLEMCEKAKELQEKWSPQEWHCYCEKGVWNNDKIQEVKGDLSDEEIDDLKTNYYWIPRSNRLYGMMGRQRDIIEGYEDFCERKKNRHPLIRDLEYAMHSICGKEWNEKERKWIRK